MKIKTFKNGVIILFILIPVFISCKKDPVEPEPILKPDYAMTAKINGELHELNNTFGTNEASTNTIFTYYPPEEYILLQGKNGAFGGIAIQLWINRDHLKLGTYNVGFDTDGETTHIDLINNLNDDNGSILENTSSGSVTITFIDTSIKQVKGTFEFNSVDGDSENDPVLFKITEGTFDYLYDV